VANAARAIDDAELSETRLTQLAYWAALHLVLNTMNGPISGNQKPQPQSWMAYRVGRTDFNFEAATTRQKKQIRVVLYLKGENAKPYFRLLIQQKAEIEREIGYVLEWDDMPTRQDCRIGSALENADPEDRADWRRQHE